MSRTFEWNRNINQNQSIIQHEIVPTVTNTAPTIPPSIPSSVQSTVPINASSTVSSSTVPLDTHSNVQPKYTIRYIPPHIRDNVYQQTNNKGKRGNRGGKNNKERIPPTVKNSVWNKFVGPDVKRGECFSCGIEPITTANFQCGHIQSEAHGGKVTIENLRPICNLCNSSMGSENMVDFINKYGFVRNKNWDGIASVKVDQPLAVIDEPPIPVRKLKTN
jgi:5-methylcytosine-specific restriction endonuclease McrA